MAALLLAGCAHLETRSEIARQNQHLPPPPTVVKPVPRPAEMSPPALPPPGPPPTPQLSNTGLPGPVPATPNAPAVPLPQRILPKIGLILGPGSMKAYAELGVLEAFEKARIPIRALVGMEWGALVAASYSLHGKAFDAEWKMLKLTQRDIPSPGFLSRRLEPENISVMHRYLYQTFRDRSVESGTIPFSCLAENIHTGGVLWLRSGSYYSALERCLPFPPYFKPNKGWIPGIFHLRAQAAELRRQGINLVIYVNVLDQNVVNDRSLVSPSTALLWLGLQNSVQADRQIFDEVINVPTGGYGLTDFAARRNLLRSGVRAGRIAAHYLQQKYGL